MPAEWIVAVVLVVYFWVSVRVAACILLRRLAFDVGYKDILIGGLIALVAYLVLRFSDWNIFHILLIPVLYLLTLVFRLLHIGRASRRAVAY